MLSELRLKTQRTQRNFTQRTQKGSLPILIISYTGISKVEDSVLRENKCAKQKYEDTTSCDLCVKFL